jgi:hypothetical protein
MTQNEIIEMLRASCDKDKVDPERNGFWVIVTEELVRFANAVAQHEREACAKFIENCSLPDSYSEPCLVEFAKDIRAGEHT